MVEVREIATGVYNIRNSAGRLWTLTRNAMFPDIRNECGQRIDPNGTLGMKLVGLVEAAFPV